MGSRAMEENDLFPPGLFTQIRADEKESGQEPRTGPKAVISASLVFAGGLQLENENLRS